MHPNFTHSPLNSSFSSLNSNVSNSIFSNPNPLSPCNTPNKTTYSPPTNQGPIISSHRAYSNPSPSAHYPTFLQDQSPTSPSAHLSPYLISSPIASFSLNPSNLNAADTSHLSSSSSSSSTSSLSIFHPDTLAINSRSNTISLPSHPMTTRAKVNIFNQKILLSTSLIDWSLMEPTRVKDALATPSWKHSMNEEYNSLVKNQTWHLIPPSSDLNVIGSKWVF
ncbi:hypothetical protein IC582_020935 [Cucumis melo]